jgi:hypothetical protein
MVNLLASDRRSFGPSAHKKNVPRSVVTETVISAATIISSLRFDASLTGREQVLLASFRRRRARGDLRQVDSL